MVVAFAQVQGTVPIPSMLQKERPGERDQSRFEPLRELPAGNRIVDGGNESAQPSLDAGEMTRNQMKLAMAVGTNRHYAIHTIVGRHFVQTARDCGLPDKAARHVIEELADTAAGSIDRVISRLPNDFPEKIAASIGAGAKRRARSLAWPAGKI